MSEQEHGRGPVDKLPSNNPPDEPIYDQLEKHMMIFVGDTKDDKKPENVAGKLLRKKQKSKLKKARRRK